VKRFRGGLVFKAHRLLYHSTLGSRVIKKKKKFVPAAHDRYRSSQYHGALPIRLQATIRLECFDRRPRMLQGYLAYKKLQPPRTLQ